MGNDDLAIKTRSFETQISVVKKIIARTNLKGYVFIYSLDNKVATK
jgi:hypothetical protein